MADQEEPLVKLEPGGKATILSYNVPEPTAYTGRNFIDLDFGDGYLRTDLTGDGAPAPGTSGTGATASASLSGRASVIARRALGTETTDVYSSVTTAMKLGFADKTVFPNLAVDPGTLWLAEEPPGEEVVVSQVPISPKLANLKSREVAAMLQAGFQLNVYRSINGTLTYNYVDPTPPRTEIHYGGPIGHAGLLNITSPDDGAVISGPSTGVTLRVEGTAAGRDAGAGIPQTNKVEVQIGPNALTEATPGRIVGGIKDWTTWSISGNITVAGDQLIKAKATSAGGTIEEVEVTVTVALTPAGTQDTTPPQVAITSPTSGSRIPGLASGVIVTVLGTASDSGTGVRAVHCNVDGDRSTLVAASPKAPGDFSTWTASLRISEPGRHTILGRAEDAAGNVAEARIEIKTEIVRPRLLLAEVYRLSSFLGSYGAGRTVKSFSLLPGERTKISVKTFTKSATDASSASSILDSLTQDSADDFENNLSSEQSDKEGYNESQSYKVSASADAGWGWGSAKMSASSEGSTNASREEFGKNVSSATQKHAAKASAKRDVQVNTSYEVKEETGEETSIEREIANINLSRTLNFVFRQINQEFVTILHLVDARIGYFNPLLDPVYREVTLPQIDSLLEDVVERTRKEEVKSRILFELTNVLDFQDAPQTFIQKSPPLKDLNGNNIAGSDYQRVRKSLTSLFKDSVTGSQFEVPGIILSVDKHVLRTEGVLVEALLGEGEALDPYAKNLQEIDIRKREAEASKASAEASQIKLINKLVQDDDPNRAKLLAELLCPCGPDSPTLKIAVESKKEGAS